MSGSHSSVHTQGAPEGVPAPLACPKGQGVQAMPLRDSYGTTTGQTAAPLVVQTMRPWMDGLMGEWAAM